MQNKDKNINSINRANFSMKKIIKDKNGFIALAVFLAIFPIVWFILDATNTPSKLGLPVNSVPGQWAVVLIGYFASALSAIAGFIATAYSVNKSIEHQNQVRKQDNAIAALPLVGVECTNDLIGQEGEVEIERICLTQEKTLKNDCVINEIFKNPFLKFSLQNKGQREMYNLRLLPKEQEKAKSNKKDSILFPVVYLKDKKIISIKLKVSIPCNKDGTKLEHAGYSEYESEPASIEFFFDDCYGNTYSQLVELRIGCEACKINGKKYKFYDNSRILECKVISAPKSYGRSNIND